MAFAGAILFLEKLIAYRRKIDIPLENLYENEGARDNDPAASPLERRQGV
jgi:hypothetical protein